jgi:hypothetical protein
LKDAIAPITASLMIFGGGAFLFFTLGIEGSQVENSHLIISGLMGSAATFLFGDAVQRQTAQNQPTITTTSGPPPTTTVAPPVGGYEETVG